MKNFKVKQIITAALKGNNGSPITRLELNGNISITLCDCWYSGHNYNTAHNTMCVEFEGFFITIPCRKPSNYRFHSGVVALQKEKERAEKIAKQIVTSMNII